MTTRIMLLGEEITDVASEAWGELMLAEVICRHYKVRLTQKTKDEIVLMLRAWAAQKTEDGPRA